MATKPISKRPIDLLDDKPGFSNYGPGSVHLAAPGVGILSTHYFLRTPAYRRYTGTSPAAAHVSGAAAIIRALRPGWSAAQVRNHLVATVDRSRYLRCISGGRLNLERAICGLL
jgi:subtilisin family serine protease